MNKKALMVSVEQVGEWRRYIVVLPGEPLPRIAYTATHLLPVGIDYFRCDECQSKCQSAWFRRWTATVGKPPVEMVCHRHLCETCAVLEGVKW